MTIRPSILKVISEMEGEISERLSIQKIELIQQSLENLPDIANDEESIALLDIFNRAEDGLFGLMWNIVHFVETAPNWPPNELKEKNSYWINMLIKTAINSGKMDLR